MDIREAKKVLVAFTPYANGGNQTPQVRRTLAAITSLARTGTLTDVSLLHEVLRSDRPSAVLLQQNARVIENIIGKLMNPQIKTTPQQTEVMHACVGAFLQLPAFRSLDQAFVHNTLFALATSPGRNGPAAVKYLGAGFLGEDRTGPYPQLGFTIEHGTRIHPEVDPEERLFLELQDKAIASSMGTTPALKFIADYIFNPGGGSSHAVLLAVQLGHRLYLGSQGQAALDEDLLAGNQLGTVTKAEVSRILSFLELCRGADRPGGPRNPTLLYANPTSRDLGIGGDRGPGLFLSPLHS